MFVSGEAGILHADADAFFASVEQRDDPRLRGRPVAVGGGVVMAASYEARRFGVRGAMGGRQARRLCPGLIVVPPRFQAYVDASRELFRVFDDVSPVVEGLSLEEAFLDVRGLERISGTPRWRAARRSPTASSSSRPAASSPSCTRCPSSASGASGPRRPGSSRRSGS
jgi:DNA polymerase-4